MKTVPEEVWGCSERRADGRVGLLFVGAARGDGGGELFSSVIRPLCCSEWPSSCCRTLNSVQPLLDPLSLTFKQRIGP